MADVRKHLYRPYVLVSADADDNLTVEFDWSDCYQGYEEGQHFFPDDYNQDNDNDDIIRVDKLFGEWLRSRTPALWGVSTF